MGGASPRRRRLDLVADAYLPGVGSGREDGAAGSAAEAPVLVAAAPGTADTSAVLAALAPGARPGAVADLGGAIGVRLGRLERSPGSVPAPDLEPILVWCPRAEEGMSLAASLALGRLSALLRPRRIAVLWFAGARTRLGRAPTPLQQAMAARLAGAAVPAAPVAVHCLGWTEDPWRQLADLARRFL